jgi:hypothetical protein
MTKAEEAALKAYPNVLFPFTPLDLNAYRREAFINGYEAAEKGTIESVCKWFEEHFVDMSHYSDRGSFGRIETTDFDSMEDMFNNLKKAMEEK